MIVIEQLPQGGRSITGTCDMCHQDGHVQRVFVGRTAIGLVCLDCKKVLEAAISGRMHVEG